MGKIVNVPFGARVKITQAKKSRAVQRKHYRTRWPIFNGTKPFRIGILDETLSYNDSATVSIYTGTPPSAVDSGENLTAWCWKLRSGQSIAAGSYVDVAYTGDHWEVVNVSCPATE